MPDLTAGSRVLAIDTPPTVADTQNDSFSFDSTSFGVDADSGTYAHCAVAFTAPTSGRVIVHTNARLTNSGANATLCAPVVREGSTIGSGSVVVAAAEANAVGLSATGIVPSAGRTLLVDGLTPGDAYHVRLEHRVGGGTGTIDRRHVIVAPAT